MSTPDDTPDDPYADRPDRWEESDDAWEQKWSDEPAEDEIEALKPPSDVYRPPAPTTASVTDAYGDGMRAAGPHLGLGMQIAASMAFFVGLGYLADRALGSTPWGVIAGAVLGMVGILALVVRVANEATAKRK